MALHRINAELVDWASQQAKPGRWLQGGEVELFFDDAEIEVQGHKFAGAHIHYEGNRALSWQTLWYGPWLLDGILDGAGDVSEHLHILISLKMLDLPDDAQGWRIRTIIRYLLTVPVSVSTHARYEVARLCIPAGWLRWWRLLVDHWVPRRKRVRPVTEAVDSA